MGRDLEAVRRIIDAFEDSDWQTIDVRFGDVRVVLSTATTGAGDGQSPVRVDEGAARDTTAVAEADEDEAEDEADDEDEPGVVNVSSPSPGIFWRSPEPGAPPFVDVGTVVEPSSTVCIVEIMKLMNHVKSGVSGRIVRVLAGNGEPVDKGAPLFAVAPDHS